MWIRYWCVDSLPVGMHAAKEYDVDEKNKQKDVRESGRQNGQRQDESRRQKHEDRVTPEKDHPTGHLGYTRENLKDVVSTRDDDNKE